MASSVSFAALMKNTLEPSAAAPTKLAVVVFASGSLTAPCGAETSTTAPVVVSRMNTCGAVPSPPKVPFGSVHVAVTPRGEALLPGLGY